MSGLLLLWAITGGAIATAIMIRIWLPDPPPDVWGRFARVLGAGVAGGLAGGVVIGMSDPMPIMPLLGAVAGAVLLSGITTLTSAPKRAGV